MLKEVTEDRKRGRGENGKSQAPVTLPRIFRNGVAQSKHEYFNILDNLD
jgi:hypothetical protein